MTTLPVTYSWRTTNEILSDDFQEGSALFMISNRASDGHCWLVFFCISVPCKVSCSINHANNPFFWALPSANVLICEVMSDSVTPWTVAHHAPLSMGFSPVKNPGVGCHFLLRALPPIHPQTLGTMAQVTAAFLRLHSCLKFPPWLEHKVGSLCALLCYTLLAGIQSNTSLCLQLYGGFIENNYFNYVFVAPPKTPPQGPRLGTKASNKHYAHSSSLPPAPNPFEVLSWGPSCLHHSL